MGFGAVDALAAVTAAATWTNLPAVQTWTSATDAVGAPVPDNNLAGVTRVINAVSTLTTKQVDHVVVEIQVPTAELRHLEIRLTSPAGTVVRLLNPEGTISAAGPGMMRLGAAHFLGEMSDGNWTLNVRDVQAGTTALFTDWRLILYGH
jgi:subtilisin-like proprotein convertase family protein